MLSLRVERTLGSSATRTSVILSGALLRCAQVIQVYQAIKANKQLKWCM